MLDHKAWLSKATGDLKSAKKLFKEDDETLDTAAYHTQQCVEKALKAFLIFKHIKPPKTHDLSKLLDQCMVFDTSLKEFCGEIITLIPYAIYSRYPDDYFVICRSDVEVAITIAKKILALIEEKTSNAQSPNLTIFDMQ